MKNDELRTKIKQIVRDAIESQMDWDSYYEGNYEQPVDEIMSLIYQYEGEKK